MKLYIKQKVFTIGDNFEVFDENQNTVFKVNGELFRMLSKFHLKDSNGNEIFTIERRFSFGYSYEIKTGGRTVAIIKKQMAFFNASFDIQAFTGDTFLADGNIFGWDFTITKNGAPYATLSKKLLSWGDSYEIEVYDNAELAFATAIVVAIDNCIHNENR